MRLAPRLRVKHANQEIGHPASMILGQVRHTSQSGQCEVTHRGHCLLAQWFAGSWSESYVHSGTRPAKLKPGPREEESRTVAAQGEVVLVVRIDTFCGCERRL